MLTFKEYIDYQTELLEYNKAISLLENYDKLNEGLLDSLSSGIKQKLDFFKQLSDVIKLKIEDLIVFLKNKNVFEFFKGIKFNLKSLFKLLKTGYNAYNQLHDVITDIIVKKFGNMKSVKWTKEKLIELQQYLNEFPKARKLIGVGLAGLLLYLWFIVGFTGNIDYDFDFSSILEALKGNYDLVDVFGGHNGVKLLLIITTGTLGLGFPWANETSVNFIAGLLYTLAKQLKITDKITNILKPLLKENYIINELNENHLHNHFDSKYQLQPI